MKRAEHQLLIRELIGLLCILAAVFLVFFLGSYPFIKYLSVQRLWLGYRIIVGLDPIATKLDSQEIRDNLEDLQVGFMIVDEDFQVIYYSESFYDPGSSAINMEKHKEEYTETPAIDMGKDWLGEIFRLRAKVTGSNGDSFYVYVYKNIHHILRRIEYTKQVLFVFCLIVWGIWFVYQRLLLRRIFSFPGDIVSVTKKLAEGHYSVRVKERKTDNEWEEMGADLNELGKRLLYSDASMKNYRYFSKTQSHDEDEKLLQEKQLMNNITHQLKTPLAIISSQLELEHTETDSEKKEYYYQSILEEIDKMSNLIRVVLKNAKTGYDSLPVHLRRTNLTDLVRELVPKYENWLSDEGIVFSSYIEEGVEAQADPAEIEHVIHNFMMNACGHTRKNKEVTLSLRKEEDFCRIAVHNEGDGIPAGELENIWKGYYQEKPYNGEAEVGLGLYIVKDIVTKHHGSCGVANDASGVEFWIRIPRAVS